MPKVLFCCTPGYIKGTGYYFRVQRDRETFERLGYDVDILVISGVVSFLVVFLKTFFLKKYSFVLFENIGASLPFLLRIIFVRKGGAKKFCLVHHGSLDDLKSFRFYVFRRFVYERLESMVVRKGISIACVSQRMIEYLQEKYGNVCCRLFLSPNIPSKSFIEKSSALSTVDKYVVRESLGLPLDKKIVCYSGNAQVWQKADLLCDVINVSAGSIFYIILTGDEDKFRCLLSGSSGNFEIKKVDNDIVPEYLRASDALYILRDDSDVNRLSCPTKAVEYLISGTPLLISENLGDISTDVSNFELGLVLESSNLDSASLVADKIESFLSIEYFEYEKRSIEVRKKYSLEYQDKVFARIIGDLRES